MLPLKGIWQNSPHSRHPEGFSLMMEGGVFDEGILKNENGCENHSASFSALGYDVIGKANLKYGDKLIFSKGNDTDHIGIIKADGTYENKVSYGFGFNLNYPIDVEVEYNFKGDVIAAFTDGLNSPKIINLNDIPAVIQEDSFNMFLGFKEPKIDTELIETGGSFLSGAHYPFIRFKKADGSESPISRIGNAVFTTTSVISQGYNKYTGVKAGSTTSNSIQLNLSELDVNYDSILIGFVSKVDGIVSARIYKEESITGETMQVTVLGNELVKTVDLKEVTSTSINYKTIKHLTKVNGVLYGAVVTEEDLLNFQKWALQIKLKWNSKLLTSNDIAQSYKVHEQHGKTKTFLHQEVYGFAIKLKIKGMGWTRAFHIPGRVAQGTENELNSVLLATDPSLVNDLNISPTSKFFQTRDTSNTATKEFGFWENENEVYPDDEEFASFEISPGVFTEDLRGKKVRHHKFPSIRKLKQTLYATEPAYGKNKMDALGIEIDSFPILPTDLSDRIEGWELCYIERSPTHSTVVGQSLLMYGAKRADEYGDSRVYTTSGNWSIVQDVDLSNRALTSLHIDRRRLRFNSLDLLLNKPAVSPSYISNQLKFRSENLQDANMETQLWRWTFVNDYTVNSTVDDVANADHIRKINGFKYIPANTNSGDVINYLGEETAVANIEGSELNTPTNDGMFLARTQTAPRISVRETTFLTNLMQYKTDMYVPLQSQRLVSTGTYVLIGDDITNLVIHGGDAFISDNSYISSSPISSDGSPYTNEFNAKVLLSVVRRYFAETVNNFSLRHEDESVPESKFYPVSSLSVGSFWFEDWENTRARNRIVYNKDYTSINNVTAILAFNSKDEFTTSDPYKIIRSKIPNLEERSPSWRTFLANDYYIIPRDKGFITNIQGVGENLFINTETSLLKTRSSEELATDSFKVVLGTGNIFDRPPVEVIIDEEGYAGCQHKHSCLLTRFGYFFVDENKKKIFLVGDDAKDITAGLHKFFESKLITTDDNPYIEKGYTVGWDEKYERLILSSVEADFTYSYYPKLENWVSSHRYRPTLLMGDRNALFAFKNKSIFKHNVEGVKGIYYDDVIHPFYLVTVFTTGDESFSFASINWRTEFLLEGVHQRDVTFDEALLWNSYQASSNIPLIPFDVEKSLEENFDSSNIRRIKERWNFNKFKDVVVNRNEKFIDGFNIVQSNINVSPTATSGRRLADNFLIVKLLFSNKKINNLQGDLKVLDINTVYNIAKR